MDAAPVSLRPSDATGMAWPVSALDRQHRADRPGAHRVGQSMTPGTPRAYPAGPGGSEPLALRASCVRAGQSEPLALRGWRVRAGESEPLALRGRRVRAGESEPLAVRASRVRAGESEPLAPVSGHPRSKPASRTPLQ